MQGQAEYRAWDGAECTTSSETDAMDKLSPILDNAHALLTPFHLYFCPHLPTSPPPSPLSSFLPPSCLLYPHLCVPIFSIFILIASLFLIPAPLSSCLHLYLCPICISSVLLSSIPATLVFIFVPILNFILLSISAQFSFWKFNVIQQLPHSKS